MDTCAIRPHGCKTVLSLPTDSTHMASEPAVNGAIATQPTDLGFGFFFGA